MQYEVGQKVWFVPHDSRTGTGRGLVVTSVGRKWVQLGLAESPQSALTYRVERGRRDVDGGQYSSPGNVYASEQAYNDHIALTVAWVKLGRAFVAREAPPGVVMDDILAAAKLLKVTL